VTIGNGPTSVDGTYWNAQNIADNLVFTSILVQAVSAINVDDDVDFSTSTFGTPNFNLNLSAPTINLNHNLSMAPQGISVWSPLR
jgi:hypothetical protein